MGLVLTLLSSIFVTILSSLDDTLFEREKTTYGRVDGSYDAPHLPFKSGRESFPFIQLPKTLAVAFTPVRVLMATSVESD